MQSVLAETGWSAAEWAKRASVAPTTITRAMRPNYDFLTSAKTLVKLASVSPATLPAPTIVSEKASGPVPIEPIDAGLPVRYRVQAGNWIEVEDIDEPDSAGEFMPLGRSTISADPRFPTTEQWAEQIEGDSIDKLYPHGSFIHVVSVIGSGVELKSGHLVVVQRWDGHKRERTVKRVFRNGDAFEMVGESNNPRWNKPFTLPDTDDQTVEVVGIVIGGYRPVFL
jgi:SOS-response transcriptional repressor LexA